MKNKIYNVSVIALLFADVSLAQESEAPSMSFDEVHASDEIVEQFVDETGLLWVYQGQVTEYAENIPYTQDELAEIEEDFEDDGSLSILFDDGREYISFPSQSAEESTENKQDAALGEFLEPLTLTQILPPDNTANPWQWIAQYTVRDRRGRTFSCSAGLVGPRHLATAAHCLHTGKRRGSWRGLPTVWVARAGNCANASQCPMGIRSAIARVVPTSWRGGARRRWPVDRGVIILGNSDRLPAAYGSFEYRAVDAQRIRRSRVATAGYPGNRAWGTMWTDTCSTRRVLPRRFFHNCNAGDGQSGSVIWLEGTTIVVGVHSGDGGAGVERATRMNGDFVRMINNQRARFP